MKTLVTAFIILWLIFAFFHISFDRDVVNAYTANERSDYKQNDGLPRLLPYGVKEYRIRGDKIVGRVGDLINEYEDCTIFNEDNWSCTHSDESATFGVKQGLYFENINIDKFPYLDNYSKSETLPRFGYILLQCRWDATGGIDVIMCLFRPFTI